MPIKFTPLFSLTPKTVNNLMIINGIKEKLSLLPLTITVLASLRETAKLYTTHYSTMIEGNQLLPNQIQGILKHDEHFPGRERDEKEVKGYYAALELVEQWAAKGSPITENLIQKLHALVMSDGRKAVKPTPYRDGQNVTRDAQTRSIVYMPPEAKDVPDLMEGLMKWVALHSELPAPIIAGIAHYQFATIHPYYDGNGRTARLLATLILHREHFDLKGLYSLEEYYARNLGLYYEALSIGPSHNYYLGRAEADITKWVDYFVEGMKISFEKVIQRLQQAQLNGDADQEALLRKLDPKQRKALELFQTFDVVTSIQVGKLFGFKPRSCSQLCKQWVEEGFLEITNYSNKGRKYRLGKSYTSLILQKH